MFPCACSLRSTQCAALIALASVAGLARFERTKASARGAKETAATHSVTSDQASLAAWARSIATFFAGDSYSFSDSRLIPAATTSESEAPPSGRGSFARTQSLQSAFTPRPELVFAPPCRNHLIPFAVGPPVPGRHGKTHFAAGTKLPGDSAAGGVKVFRIVRFSPKAKDAWVFCPAGNPTRTGSALRGELASRVSAVPVQATAWFVRHRDRPDAAHDRRTARFLS